MHESRSLQAVLEKLAALGRRWRIFVPFAIVTPLVVLALTSSTPRMYESSAEVLLNRQGVDLSGLRDSTVSYPIRTLMTQAELARLYEVARRVVEAAELPELDAFGFLGQSSVIAEGWTDLMTFQVRDRDPEQAARLATIYAEQYVAYRKDLDTQSLRRAIAVVGGQLKRSRAQGTDPSIYGDLVQKQQQLDTALTSLEANATLVGPAVDATRIAPRPLRASLIALALGLIVGIGLAGLAGLLDPRARTANEISELLGLPLLARLPVERRTRRGSDGLVMLRREDGPEAEAIRVLRANLVDPLASQQGIVMVTSSVAGEGKSTTVANLAVALALAGRSVALVDLDLRRPAIRRLFHLPSSPGMAEVVRGTTELEDALHLVPLDRPRDQADDGPQPAKEQSLRGTLRIVTAGAAPSADATEIVAGRALPAALDSLRRVADVVLVDSPPLLQSSDALGLSALADGLLFIANTRLYRRRYTQEIARLLALSPASPLGLVVIGEPGELEFVARHAYVDRRDLHRDLGALGRA
jgi:succinoglycan biosynthesis transport protein ExoP